MRQCTAAIHKHFYPDNRPLPLSEFQHPTRNIVCKQCKKCRDYYDEKRQEYIALGKIARYKTDKLDQTPYETMCLFCTQPDCIRVSGEERASHDRKYLNKCVLAVARYFNLEPRIAPDQIIVKDKIIKWQHLEKKQCSV